MIFVITFLFVGLAVGCGIDSKLFLCIIIGIL